MTNANSGPERRRWSSSRMDDRFIYSSQSSSSLSPNAINVIKAAHNGIGRVMLAVANVFID